MSKKSLDEIKDEASSKDTIKGKTAGSNGGYKDKSASKRKDYAEGNTKDSVSRGAGKYGVGSVNAVRLSDATALNFDMPISGDVGYLSANVNGGFGLVKEHNIFVVKYIPTLGNTDAANLAASKMAGEARKELKVIQSYAPGDLFCYDLAVQSLFECIEYGKRIVRLANSYITHNFLYPKMALKAMGIDLDEVITNGPLYREILNKAIVAAQNCAIPKLFDSANLRIRLNSQIYVDDMTRKAQSYIFKPEGFWQWDLTTGTSTQPSDMKFLVNNITNATTLQQMLTALLNPLITDQDAMYIHGDILKVWGESAFIIPAEAITYDQTQDFTYDPMLLYMLHNATIHMGIDGNSTLPTIYWTVPSGSTSPYLTQKVYVKSWKTMGMIDVLDSPIENPSAADVANFCRWKSWTKAVNYTLSNPDPDAEVMSSGILSMPLEVLTSLDCFEFDIPSNTATSRVTCTHAPQGSNANVNYKHTDVLAVRPIGYELRNETISGVTDLTVQHLRGDRAWYTLIDMPYAGRINTVVTELNYDL